MATVTIGFSEHYLEILNELHPTPIYSHQTFRNVPRHLGITVQAKFKKLTKE